MTWSLVLATLAVAQVPSPRYELTYSRENPRTVHVEAEFVLADTQLAMIGYGAEHLPDGWRAFVRNERLLSTAGSPIGLERLPARKWRVRAALGTPVRLVYDVEIAHDLQPWTPNAREAAYVRPWGVFAVGRALFIYNTPDARDIRVRVNAPEGWTASTAWTSTAGNLPRGAGDYTVPSWGDVINSVIFVGGAERFTVTEGTMSVAYVVGGPGFETSIPHLQETTGRILRAYGQLFGGAPPSSRLLVVINPDSTVLGGGGGVFRQSISMTFQAPPSLENIGGWGHTLAHEFFHVWNATALRRAGERVEWFVEGWADYYAVLTMTRLGYLPGPVWAFKAGNWLQEYEQVAGRISLEQAGIQEWEPPGPQMLYNGGAVAAFALDVALRTARPRGAGLDDVLRLLYRQYGNTGVGVTNQAIEAAVTEAGFDATGFFQAHVAGTRPIPTVPITEFVGIEGKGRSSRLLGKPDADQQVNRARYFGASARLTPEVAR